MAKIKYPIHTPKNTILNFETIIEAPDFSDHHALANKIRLWSRSINIENELTITVIRDVFKIISDSSGNEWAIFTYLIKIMTDHEDIKTMVELRWK